MNFEPSIRYPVTAKNTSSFFTSRESEEIPEILTFLLIFNNKDDFESYPRNLTEDLELLKKLKVDIIYLPSINQIYKSKNFPKIILKK